MKRTTFILCLLVVITTNLFSQQFELPKPTGPYKIGTRFLYFVDYNRPDVFTSKSDDFRELSVQVWYPAEPKSNEKPKNFSNIDALEYLVKFGFFKPSIIDDVALKPSYSYLNAKVLKSKDPYPVILYSASGVMVIFTAAVGSEFRTTVYMSPAPPSVTSVEPSDSVIVMPAASLSVMSATTFAIPIPL